MHKLQRELTVPLRGCSDGRAAFQLPAVLPISYLGAESLDKRGNCDKLH